LSPVWHHNGGTASADDLQTCGNWTFRWQTSSLTRYFAINSLWMHLSTLVRHCHLISERLVSELAVSKLFFFSKSSKKQIGGHLKTPHNESRTWEGGLSRTNFFLWVKAGVSSLNEQSHKYTNIKVM